MSYLNIHIDHVHISYMCSAVSFAVVAVLGDFNENGFLKHSCGLSKPVMLDIFVFFSLATLDYNACMNKKKKCKRFTSSAQI